jgi:hypothetical protein
MGMTPPDFLFGLQPEPIVKLAFRLDCVAHVQRHNHISAYRMAARKSTIPVSGKALHFRQVIAPDQCSESEKAVFKQAERVDRVDKEADQPQYPARPLRLRRHG